MNPPTICGLFFNDPDPIYLREVTVGSLTLNVYKLVIDNDVLITYINYHYGEQDKGDIATYKDGMLTGEWWVFILHIKAYLLHMVLCLLNLVCIQ